MTALHHLRQTRRAILLTIGMSALAWGAATPLIFVSLVALVDATVALSVTVRWILLASAALMSLGALGWVLWRGRHARDLQRVALFVEEHAPGLEFALVTALESGAGAVLPSLESRVATVRPWPLVRRPLWMALVVPGALLIASLVSFLSIPHAWRERVLTPRVGDVVLSTRAVSPAASRLAPIVARIDPPAYAAREGTTLEDPSFVRALPGSRVLLRGRGAERGATDSLSAHVETAALRIDVVGDTWSTRLTMAQTPAVVRLRDRTFDRLIALEPLPDSAPAVALTAPLADTTLATGRGRITISATVSDDVGLAHAELEVLHTSGSGERFETERNVVASRSLTGERTAQLRAELRLDAMRLGPGDVLHIRAIARDRNDVTGPGITASDTRTIRIADPRTLDTLDIVAADLLPFDTSMVSQRMLILRAETLLVVRPRIGAARFSERAMVLSGLQMRIRSRVEQIIADLEGVNTTEGHVHADDGMPATLLHDASAAMVDAALELRTANVSAALPHMRRALRLLNQGRGAQRLYLRGQMPKIVVDVEKQRLKGTDSTTIAPREPRGAAPDPARDLLARLDRLAPILARDPAEAADSLLMVRTAALTLAPTAAQPLADAITALRERRPAAAFIVAARRRLERTASIEGPLSSWIGGR